MTRKDPQSDRTVYLGLGSTYHDPALALVDHEGSILFAEALERPLQYKRGMNMEPDNPFVLPDLLKSYAEPANRIVVASNWRAKRPWYERLAQIMGWLTPQGILGYRGRELTASLPTWELNYMQALQHQALQRAGLSLARTLRDQFPEIPFEFRSYDHHLTHAALAAYSSPFAQAACAVIDSYGERGALAFYTFDQGRLQRIAESRGPQSLGFLYMKLTELCGFNWMAGEEWKVMGLAAYGKPNHELLAILRSMIRVEGLDLAQNRTSFFQGLHALSHFQRDPKAPPETVADLAHTGQLFFMELVNQLLQQLHQRTGMKALVLGGGCALNSVTNGQILAQTPFTAVHIPSAPADDGTALGSALLAFHQDHPDAPLPNQAISPYLGSAVSEKQAARFAQHAGLPFEVLEDHALFDRVSELIAAGKIIGWMRGRAEFGPRALGHRSILADPRDPGMMERINGLVKFREQFRPYAPSILHEYGPDYFEDYQETPYMDRTLRFRKEVRTKVPAVVHVDGTGRLQSVTAKRNPDFHALITAFHQKTGVPLLLNTSFNVMGKPIAHSIEDAFGVFLGSGLDALVTGSYLFIKPASR
jgi:carbamoyltransferase